MWSFLYSLVKQEFLKKENLDSRTFKKLCKGVKNSLLLQFSQCSERLLARSFRKSAHVKVTTSNSKHAKQHFSRKKLLEFHAEKSKRETHNSVKDTKNLKKCYIFRKIFCVKSNEFSSKFSRSKFIFFHR